MANFLSARWRAGWKTRLSQDDWGSRQGGRVASKDLRPCYTTRPMNGVVPETCTCVARHPRIKFLILLVKLDMHLSGWGTRIRT
jgi:hypothetical protein